MALANGRLRRFRPSTTRLLLTTGRQLQQVSESTSTIIFRLLVAPLAVPAQYRSEPVPWV
jgi:hypothetical protein